MSAVIPSEETLVIETPERVPLHFALASIGNRFLACAIDHSLQLLVLVLMGIASLVIADYSGIESMLSSAPKWVWALFIIIGFFILSGYFAFF